METFLDGGLFELLIGILLAGIVNTIFLKKYLLIIFSVLVIATPAALFFVNKNELYYLLVSFSFLNGCLLVVLLWKEKIRNGTAPLFKVGVMKGKALLLTKKMAVYLGRKRAADAGKNVTHGSKGPSQA